MSLSFLDDICCHGCEASEFAEKLLQNCSVVLQRNHDNIDSRLLSMNMNIRYKYGDHLKNAIMELIVHLFNMWYDANENSDTMRVIHVKSNLEQMCKLKWHDLYEKEYIEAFIKLLENYIISNCQDKFTTPQIPIIKQWLNSTLQPFVLLALNDGHFNDQIVLSTPSYFKLFTNLNSSLYYLFVTVRSKSLFEIVADFPENIVAIRELKEAAHTSNSMGQIGKIFRSIIKKRLLHTGASTGQILDIYILMIRSLRIIDPSDLLLNYVAAPVRDYLMSRKDTVRSIVSSLTEGKNSELHSELRKGGSLEYGADEDDEDMGPGENWEPRKRDPDLIEYGLSGLDVLALLVSIYGSTDLFVNEYRSLLADKLLNNLCYHTDVEVETLELLKIRFGEEPLHSCEVMLRDIEDSKRINNSITSELLRTNGKSWQRLSDDGTITGMVDFAIISGNYWPGGTSDNDNSLLVHPVLDESIKLFQNMYAVLKKPRKLTRISPLGQIDLDLNFNDGSTRSFSVNPIQATIIMHLSDQNSISLHELSSKCEIEEDDLRRKIAFWMAKGVVKENYDGQNNVFYTILEEQMLNSQADLMNRSNNSYSDVMNVEESTITETKVKAMYILCESYITGMLSNQESMTLERIHTLLKLMSGSDTRSDLKYDLNIMQLHQFLVKLVDSNKIELIDGSYRNVRK